MENTCRGAFFGKVATLNLQFCRKNVLHCKYLLIGLFTFQYILDLKEKKYQFWNLLYVNVAIHFQPLQLVRLND